MHAVGYDTPGSIIAISIALLILAWAVVTWAVQRFGRTERYLRRLARHEIASRGLGRFAPVVHLYPDRRHVLITWTEGGDVKAVFLRVRHRND